MNIGSIRANNVEDPDSEASIRLGYVTGDGLLAKVVSAICELADAAYDVGYFDSEVPTDVSNRLECAWLSAYEALKTVEETT